MMTPREQAQMEVERRLELCGDTDALREREQELARFEWEDRMTELMPAPLIFWGPGS